MKNKKFSSAKAAQTSRQNKDNWEKLLEKYNILPNKSLKKNKSEYKLEIPEMRKTKKIPSLNSSHHSVTLGKQIKYTGTEILGISVLHKSNGIPVFRHSDILDVSKMRRG